MDQKLVQKIKRGDQKAFHQLYDLYFHRVINYAYKLVHSWEDAREIAQDVFIKVWNKREELEPDKSISGLMFRITKFTAIDWLRKEHVKEIFSIEENLDLKTPSLESELLDKEMYQVYQDIVSRLPEKRRYIFQLSRDEDFSHKEIAGELSISVKTVETQIRLALQHIRKELKAYSESFIIIWVLWLF